jgi:hypothetical protein
MPTTPNYGWDTPADTDYVTNGALAIRTMANDADQTVWNNWVNLNADKFDKSGGTLTSWILVPTITANGRAIGIKCDASGEGIIQFLNISGSSENGFIKITSDDVMTLQVSQSGNSLQFNNVGETTRTHNGQTRPIPFAVEMGRTTVSANSNSTVSLTTSRFTQPPLILLTAERSTQRAGVDAHSGNRTTSNFKIYNNNDEAQTFAWQAIQMTSTSAEG